MYETISSLKCTCSDWAANPKQNCRYILKVLNVWETLVKQHCNHTYRIKTTTSLQSHLCCRKLGLNKLRSILQRTRFSCFKGWLKHSTLGVAFLQNSPWSNREVHVIWKFCWLWWDTASWLRGRSRFCSSLVIFLISFSWHSFFIILDSKCLW